MKTLTARSGFFADSFTTLPARMELQSRVLGTLTQDRSFADWYTADQPLGMPFFDGLPLGVMFMEVAPGTEAAFVADADEALAAFRQLTTLDRQAASPLVLANYHAVLEASELELLEVDETNPDSIWRYVHPTEIYVERRAPGPGAGPDTIGDDADIYLLVECNCDWELEHGLQLVFRRGRMLTRVSDIDGHLTEADAYGKPDADDALLSAYNARYPS